MKSLRSILKLKPFIRPYLLLIAMSMGLAIPLSILKASPAPLLKYLIDDLLNNKDEKRLLVFPALVIAIYVANFFIRFFHYFLLRIVIARVNQSVKNAIYNHLMGLSADYFSNQSVGNLISRVASDPQYIDGGLACLNLIVREPFTFIFLFGYTCYLNWRLTLITLVIFPFLAWVFSYTGKSMKRYIGKMTEENASIFSNLQESFSGYRIISQFGLQRYLRKKFRARISYFTKLSLKIAAIEEAAHPMVELITAIAIAGVIYYGGKQVLHNEMTAGDLLAFFAAFGMMMQPIRLLNEVNSRAFQMAAACDRIFEVLGWKTHLFEAENPLRLKSLEKGLEIDNVHFFYPDAPDREILKGVSFKLEKGKTIALVGASGAGKSSLISLIPRVFDVTAGAIKIDGVDIRQFRLEDLRKLIAVVSQDVFLFNDTIEENIRCGKLSAGREDILRAAKRAHAYDFIQKLPQGFETKIGDRGLKLSGGERQRLSIARAFLREAPLLILDEATSNLDNASEKAVQEALSELMENRTVLVIAHRLSTIQKANRILVMKEGKLIEEGTHESLLAHGGEYAHFHRLSREHD